MNANELYKKVFGKGIKSAREIKGYSQEYIAEQIGVSKGTYRNLEGGQRVPTIEQIEALSNIYESDFNTLMSLVLRKCQSEIELLKPTLTISEHIDMLEGIIELHNSIINKWDEEMKKLSSNIEKKILETIEMYQRLHGGVKVLSEVEKKELLEQVSLTIDLKIKQAKRRK